MLRRSLRLGSRALLSQCAVVGVRLLHTPLAESLLSPSELLELALAEQMASSDGAHSPIIIDGNATAATIRKELSERVATLTAARGRAPGLAVVLVGSRTDSATYVRMKKKACAEVGIADFGRDLPADATQAEVLAAVAELNADDRVDGILVQLPLPAHMEEAVVLDAISHAKDADGLHPLNMGCLVLKGRTPAAVPCTPWVRGHRLQHNLCSATRAQR